MVIPTPFQNKVKKINLRPFERSGLPYRLVSDVPDGAMEVRRLPLDEGDVPAGVLLHEERPRRRRSMSTASTAADSDRAAPLLILTTSTVTGNAVETATLGMEAGPWREEKKHTVSIPENLLQKRSQCRGESDSIHYVSVMDVKDNVFQLKLTMHHPRQNFKKTVVLRRSFGAVTQTIVG